MVDTPPHISINNHKNFTYLGFTVASNLSRNFELNKRMGKPSTVMAKLSKRVWENKKLALNTKIEVYKALVPYYTVLKPVQCTWCMHSTERRLRSCRYKVAWKKYQKQKLWTVLNFLVYPLPSESETLILARTCFSNGGWSSVERLLRWACRW